MVEVLKDNLTWTRVGSELTDKAEHHIRELRESPEFAEVSHQDFHLILISALNDAMMIERLGWNSK